MDLSENPVYSTNVLEFVKTSNNYCLCIEQIDKIDLKTFIHKMHQLLPLLYYNITSLAELPGEFDENNQHFVNEQDYEYVRTKMLAKLGQHDGYEEVFNTMKDASEDAIGASISENLADIYQDIKNFVLNYEIGTDQVMMEAINECKQTFELFWGQKLTNVLRAVHFLRYTGEEIKEDIGVNQQKIANLMDVDTSNWIIRRRQEGLYNEGH